MTDNTTTQTRPANERLDDLLAPMSDQLRREFDIVVSDLLLEHERNVQAASDSRISANAAGIAEQKARLDECEQELADHIARCPGATEEERERWKRKAEQKAN